MDEVLFADKIAEKIREVSIAEFFEKNRHLLGYENPTKSLLTVVKELVDNSLDACLEARILPEIKVTVKPLDENKFKVRVEDNGPGLPPEKIPITFGKFLVGSKFYRLRQNIGTQGIGAKGVILYAQLTSGKPAKITTYYKGKEYEIELLIDVLKNEPKVVSQKEKETKKPHGLAVEVQVEGRYVEKSASIPTYLRYIWIANPYTKIVYDGPNEKIELDRVTKELPKPPKEIKPHPYGVELGRLKRMLALTNARNVVTFLTNEFCRVGRETATKICRLAKIDEKKKPQEITHEEAERLHKAMTMVKIASPPTDCLSPLSEELLINALKKEFPAEFYTAVIRKPAVYRGNPFQVQVALAYGEPLQNEQAIVLRFANHTPLLYNQSECAITKSIQQVDWRNYGLSQAQNTLPQAPIVILVDLLSVWIPYTSEGKEAIASYPEIIKEIKLALQEAGRQLKKFVSKKKKAKERELKKKIFERYIPVVAESLSKLTGKAEEDIKEKLQKFVMEWMGSEKGS